MFMQGKNYMTYFKLNVFVLNFGKILIPPHHYRMRSNCLCLQSQLSSIEILMVKIDWKNGRIMERNRRSEKFTEDNFQIKNVGSRMFCKIERFCIKISGLVVFVGVCRRKVYGGNGS